MSTFNWIQLFGVPTIILGILTLVYKLLSKRIKVTSEENKAIKSGIQALLRDRLYELYRLCQNQGSASEYDRENFENMYTQYHTLGANGVMDSVRTKFLALPMTTLR